MLGWLRHYQQRLSTELRQRRARLALRGKLGPINLHVGCGQVHFPGWIHLDADYQLPHLDALWHASDRLPFADKSCSFIYNEHFLEHLPPDVGLFFLRECRRVLRPDDGVLRVAMPDLREPVRQYWEQDWRQQPWLEKYGYTWIQTGCEMLNIAFRDWGHQWLYDREELRRRLTEAGFTKIVDADWCQSVHMELQNRETRVETLLICEASP
jgi:predicted SAM-dependent methyltransferase